MEEEERKRKEYDPRVTQKIIEYDFTNQLKDFKKSEHYEPPQNTNRTEAVPN